MSDTAGNGHRCPTCGQLATDGVLAVPGVTTIRYKGQTFQVPSLNIAGLRWAREQRMWEQIDTLRTKTAEEMAQDDSWLTLTAQVVLTALKRNYPDITIADVEEMVDLANATRLLLACRGINLDDVKGTAAATQPARPDLPNG